MLGGKESICFRAVGRDQLSATSSIDDLFPVMTSMPRLAFDTTPIRNLQHLAEYGILNETPTGGQYRFDLTDTGRKLLQVYEYTDGVGTSRKVLGACFGEGEVDTIIDYTMPTDGGPQISSVRFSWSATDLSSDLRTMAGNQKLLDMPGNYSHRGNPATSGQGKAVIQLTNQGWSVVRISRE